MNTCIQGFCVIFRNLSIKGKDKINYSVSLGQKFKSYDFVRFPINKLVYSLLDPYRPSKFFIDIAYQSTVNFAHCTLLGTLYIIKSTFYHLHCTLVSTSLGYTVYYKIIYL